MLILTIVSSLIFLVSCFFLVTALYRGEVRGIFKNYRFSDGKYLYFSGLFGYFIIAFVSANFVFSLASGMARGDHLYGVDDQEHSAFKNGTLHCAGDLPNTVRYHSCHSKERLY